ncbi:NUDIX domain-containing protein [Sphaerisporangium corydalis]|uniref:NUDIX domain-containing protein n=1 Tax=Sphaerisporangium corydalis TaxID=1441875 RepID=A0ABV9EKL0_9ACTN|nr:NUDIX hydrolase [Sphaerisporangium corydalis]
MAEGNARQARKRVAADVLIRDEAGRVLLVDPTYKDGWDLPGGMAEANEPPHLAAVRELDEELGIKITIGGMLCADWVAPHGPWDDQIAFIFDGGVMSSSGCRELTPADPEVAEVRFFPVEVALDLVRDHMRPRLQAALRVMDTGHALYLHEGHPLHL